MLFFVLIVLSLFKGKWPRWVKYLSQHKFQEFQRSYNMNILSILIKQFSCILVFLSLYFHATKYKKLISEDTIMWSVKYYRVIGVIRHPITWRRSPDNHPNITGIKKSRTILCATQHNLSWHKQTEFKHILTRITWEASFVHFYNPRNSDILIPFHWCLSSYPLGTCVVFKYSNIPSLKADIVSWWPTGIYSGYANTSRRKNSQQPLLNLSQYVYV